MIENRITPQVMCAACGHIFPTPTIPTDETTSEVVSGTTSEVISGATLSENLAEEVTCPACNAQGKPKGVMQPSGFPSLETFQKNWKKSNAVTTIDSKESKALAKSSDKG